jgi:hypothetical protein
VVTVRRHANQPTLPVGTGLSTGQTLALGIVLVLALVVVPVAGIAATFQRVLLVGPSGTALKTANGSLDIGDGKGALTVNGTVNTVVQQTGTPLHLQFEAVALQMSLLSSLPATARLHISSFAVTSDAAIGAGSDTPDFILFAAPVADCSSTSNYHFVAYINVNKNTERSAEFTYPTPVLAPHGFTPSGSWCLGLRDTGSGFVSVDGFRT